MGYVLNRKIPHFLILSCHQTWLLGRWEILGLGFVAEKITGHFHYVQRAFMFFWLVICSKGILCLFGLYESRMG